MLTTSPQNLASTIDALHPRLEGHRAVLCRESPPDFGAVRAFVRELDLCVAALNAAAGVPGDRADLVRASVVHGSFPALLLLLSANARAALDFLVEEWRRTAEALGGLEPGSAWRVSELREPAAHYLAFPDREIEILTLFNTAVFEILRSTENQSRGQEILRHLMIRLSLSYDQLGRAFGVSGETVRRWEHGSHEIPADRMAVLGETDAALERLGAIFKPERLAHVLRRKAGLFSDESALDWILRGRMSEVADRYEATLAYQA